MDNSSVADSQLDSGGQARFVVDDSYIMVDSDNLLAALCEEWKQGDFVAMDTEFMRTSTFFPHAGLFQVSAGGANFLIDPLAISDWNDFSQLMTNPGITKIFHSCSEDLQVFMAKLDLVPGPVFDTQIAAAFLNEGFGNSYQAIVKHYLAVDLPKGETRSDWLQRPLSEQQCHYAALDVACLPTIFRHQQTVLEKTGKLAWCLEECESLLGVYREEMAGDFTDYYLNIRGAWQLDKKQLGILRKLAEWRELRARKRDKPRNWIVRDKQLLDMAKQAPITMEALSKISDLGKNFLRYEGDEITSLIRTCLDGAPEADVEMLPRPLDGRAKQRLKRGMQFVEDKASEFNLPVEMLARKRWLVTLLQNNQANEKHGRSSGDPDLPTELSGWRYPLLMPGLLDALG